MFTPFLASVSPEIGQYIEVKDVFPDGMRGIVWSLIKAIYSFGSGLFKAIGDILQIDLITSLFNDNWAEIELICWAVLFVCFIIFLTVKSMNPNAYKGYVRQLLIAVTMITCMGYLSGLLQQSMHALGDYAHSVAMSDNPLNTIVLSQTYDMKKSIEEGRLITLKELNPDLVGTSIDILYGEKDAPLNFKVSGYDLEGNVTTAPLDKSWLTLGKWDEKVYLYNFNGFVIVMSCLAVILATLFSLWKIIKTNIEMTVLPICGALAISSDISGNRTKKVLEAVCQGLATLFISIFMFKLFADLLMAGSNFQGFVAMLYYLAVCGFMFGGSDYFARLCGVDTSNDNLVGNMLQAMAVRGVMRGGVRAVTGGVRAMFGGNEKNYDSVPSINDVAGNEQRVQRPTQDPSGDNTPHSSTPPTSPPSYENSMGNIRNSNPANYVQRTRDSNQVKEGIQNNVPLTENLPITEQRAKEIENAKKKEESALLKQTQVNSDTGLNVERKRDSNQIKPNSQDVHAFSENSPIAMNTSPSVEKVNEETAVNSIAKEGSNLVNKEEGGSATVNKVNTQDNASHVQKVIVSESREHGERQDRYRDRSPQDEHKVNVSSPEEEIKATPIKTSSDHLGKKNIIRPKRKEKEDELDLGLMYKKKKEGKQGNEE